MRRNIITTIILCCIAVTALNAQGNRNQDRQYNSEEERKRLVTNFRNTYERARDRIDRLQERAPLRREVTYEEEEELLREARQMLDLLEEGNYIKRSEIKEYEKKLNKIGNKGKADQAQSKQSGNNDQSVRSNRPDRSDNGRSVNRNRINEGISRSEDVIASGEEAVQSTRKRINEVKQKLEEQRRNNRISEADYNSKMNRVRQAEVRMDNLEDRLEQERQTISELKQQIEEPD